MSYVGICEVMLHLNNFSIFDEYSDGYYKLKSSIYYEKLVPADNQKGKEKLKVPSSENRSSTRSLTWWRTTRRHPKTTSTPSSST